jgi:hypothetical protein
VPKKAVGVTLIQESANGGVVALGNSVRDQSLWRRFYSSLQSGESKVTVIIPKDALRVHFFLCEGLRPKNDWRLDYVILQRIAEEVGMAEELSLFFNLLRCCRSGVNAEKHNSFKEERRHSGEFFLLFLERVQCQGRLRVHLALFGPEPQQDSCHLNPTLKFLLLCFGI